MTDDPQQQSMVQSVSRDVRTALVVFAFALSIAILVGIIVAALWMTVSAPEKELPSHLKEWAGVALGFLAGTLFKWASEKI